MALNASILSMLARAEILSRPGIQALDNSGLTDLCDALAAAVITHITTAGVVTVPLGVPVATAGTALAQTGATTAPAIGAIS